MEREMREEMRAHIAQATERFIARGMSEREARFAAQREFGQMGAIEQSARDARGGEWADSVAADIKYALRYFLRTPLTAITIILTLALGIGFSSAVFSALTGILTRPAPGVPDEPALVKIRGISGVDPRPRLLSYSELSAYAALNDKFASVVGWVTAAAVIDAGNRDIGVFTARVQFVTPNYFRTLGIRLADGRGFAQSQFAELAPAELTAIVSDAIATEQFGGARAALGKRVKVNDVEVTNIGVAPRRFAGPVQSGETRLVWMPLSAWQLVANVHAQVFTDPNAASFDAAARLQSGVTVADATAAVRVVAARENAVANAQATPTTTASADVVPMRGIIELGRYTDEMGPSQIVFPAIALLILLVCTTTVSSLLVGKAVGRRHEIGVRLALGASRRRVVRQLVTEVFILALAGGALGLWVFGVLLRLVEVTNDGFDVSPDWKTTAFMIVYAVVTATLAGLSPALHATRAGLSDVLKDSSSATTRRSRLQGTFVVAQIAIAQPLMVVLAAVIINIASKIPSANVVALRERIVVADLDAYIGSALKAPDRTPALVRRLGELPGVVTVLPVGDGQGRSMLELPRSSAPEDSAAPRFRHVASAYDVPPGYFRTVEAPIVRGRDFVASDTALAVTPVIINEQLATLLFRSSDPIGRRLARVSLDGRQRDDRPTELEVVGVVRMEYETNSLGYPSDLPPMFVPHRRQPGDGRFLLRTAGPAEPLIPTMISTIRDEARLLPVRRIGTLAQGDRERRSSRLEVAGSVAGAGMITLLLAAIGLYAMVGLAVGQRRREIGIRVALGANTREVVNMFFKGGLRVAMLGLALGLPLSVVGLAILAQKAGMIWIQLPVAGTIVTTAVVSVAALASWLPARRAAGVDPMVALRPE
jgi:predicted permease